MISPLEGEMAGRPEGGGDEALHLACVELAEPPPPLTPPGKGEGIVSVALLPFAMASGVRRWKSQIVGFSWPSATTPHHHAPFPVWSLSGSGTRGPCLPNEYICGASLAFRRCTCRREGRPGCPCGCRQAFPEARVLRTVSLNRATAARPTRHRRLRECSVVHIRFPHRRWGHHAWWQAGGEKG